MLSYSFIIEVFSKINIILNEYDSIIFEFNFDLPHCVNSGNSGKLTQATAGLIALAPQTV